MLKLFLSIFILISISSLSFVLGHFYDKLAKLPTTPHFFQVQPTPKPLPLLAYTIEKLSQQEVKATSPLQVEKLLNHDPIANLYTLLFTYQSQGKQISGALNLQLDEATTASPSAMPVILMLRGYAPLEVYYSGIGTKSAASVFAQAGYVTLAPDFLGYGESDPEPDDTWEARFIKPLNILDLLATLQKFPILDLSKIEESPLKSISLDPAHLGVWAHSNGGQIAVTTLEILGQNLPTTLWAPVLAPFPYSILYFSDEYEDEGKETRKYVALFEADYDVFDFSLTRHLDRLHGPIQIHHGGRDDAALLSWSEEFLAKVDLENQRRATASALTEELEIKLYRYPSADHNLQPNWNEAIQRDLGFFAENLN